MATMTTVSSRRANCPMPTPGEAATKNSIPVGILCSRTCNGLYLQTLLSIYWRASLVPAAAVIPAPRAYINVVAVKKPVVGFESHLPVRRRCTGDPCRGLRPATDRSPVASAHPGGEVAIPSLRGRGGPLPQGPMGEGSATCGIVHWPGGAFIGLVSWRTRRKRGDFPRVSHSIRCARSRHCE